MPSSPNNKALSISANDSNKNNGPCSSPTIVVPTNGTSVGSRDNPSDLSRSTSGSSAPTENAANASARQGSTANRKKKALAKPQSKHWCFTMNNYTEDDVTRLSQLKNTQAAYIIFGREVGEQGTPHLQGFVSFPSRKRLPQVIAALGQCHCSIARLITQSIEYCKKEDENAIEVGVPPTTKGQRNDLEEFKAAVKSGLKDMKEIREEHSSVYARYTKFVKEYVKDHMVKHVVECYPLRDWQSNLNIKLNGPIDNREIIFLVDTTGNSGKSWFFQYYEQNHPDTSQIIIPGKKLDMAYILLETNRVVMFDCPRSKQGDFIQYDFLEEIKNGYVFSGKYEAVIKRFPTPHVVVAMNEHPNMDQLSADRFSIIPL